MSLTDKVVASKRGPHSHLQPVNTYVTSYGKGELWLLIIWPESDCFGLSKWVQRNYKGP